MGTFVPWCLYRAGEEQGVFKERVREAPFYREPHHQDIPQLPDSRWGPGISSQTPTKHVSEACVSRYELARGSRWGGRSERQEKGMIGMAVGSGGGSVLPLFARSINLTASLVCGQ